eukprot:TRINITY_DN1870_c0_g3_i2.p1 TRINITY_DN1870_c0_g3~~TRINITY_DN1870_c0_g3_i2.p1  ORF type:complete len:197 (-),score=45.61 TRINITY_DN1870_c0_g3_i2:135-725(-)
MSKAIVLLIIASFIAGSIQNAVTTNCRTAVLGVAKSFHDFWKVAPSKDKNAAYSGALDLDKKISTLQISCQLPLAIGIRVPASSAGVQKCRDKITISQVEVKKLVAEAQKYVSGRLDSTYNYQWRHLDIIFKSFIYTCIESLKDFFKTEKNPSCIAQISSSSILINGALSQTEKLYDAIQSAVQIADQCALSNYRP